MGVGHRKASNTLWIPVILLTFFTVISGHLSCEHIVNITQTNLLTIQTSDLKEHCDLKSVPFCPDLTKCFKDKLKLCSISNYTIKILYSLESIGKYFIECGTDNTKEVDLTEKDCKKRNNRLENATPKPYPESSSTNPKVWLLIWLTIVLVFAFVVLLAVGLFACYKNKERCCQSVKKSANYFSDTCHCYCESAVMSLPERSPLTLMDPGSQEWMILLSRRRT